jgi:hypothetical protein
VNARLLEVVAAANGVGKPLVAAVHLNAYVIVTKWV